MTKTQFWDYFSHGSKYEGEHQPEDTPRIKACNSCAFTNCKGTVRPSDISMEEMYEEGDKFDVFYCHERDKDGKYKICAAWFKLFGDLAVIKQKDAEIDEIINRME